MDSIAVPWTAELVLITWRTVRQKKRPPLPSEILASFVIFGTFSLVSVKNPEIGSMLGWGIVAATALNFLPSTPQSTGKITNDPQTPVVGNNTIIV